MSTGKLPAHLGQPSSTGIRKGESIAQFEIGDYKNFVYLVIDWPGNQTLIVDPQADLRPLQDAFREYGLKPAGVLLTHTHFDHVAGLPSLLKLYPDLPVYLNRDDHHRIEGQIPGKPHFEFTRDGQRITLGSQEIDVMHTPGHSPGENCYFLSSQEPPFLLTGDTVFIRDCGRTDLPGGSVAQMFASLQRIRKLSPQTVILPGHHYQPDCASTLERELRESPPFVCKSVQELEALP